MPRSVIDPDLIGAHAHLFPGFAQRLLAFAQEHFEEIPADAMVRFLLARAIGRDPRLRVHLPVSDSGELIGFGVAQLEEFATGRWVYSLAGKIDDGVDSEQVVPSYFNDLEQWGRQHGATHIVHATHRSERAWLRKYQFQTERAVMTRPIERVSPHQ